MNAPKKINQLERRVTMKFKRITALMLSIFVLLSAVAFAENDWRSILILGNDTRNFPKFERSDVMIIVSINEEAGKVKLTSIMRDTDVSYANGGSGKINGAMAKGGPENAVATVNKNFGMDISEYVVVDFHQMINLVNIIGGVDIELTNKERVFINTFTSKFGHFSETPDIKEAGMTHLVGWQALNYSRDRKSTPAGDFDRVARQRKMLIALLKELQEKPVEEVLELADKMMYQLSTNMTKEQLLELGKFALTLDINNIYEFRLPADGTFDAGTFGGVYKIKPNLEKNSRLLQEFISGAELKNGSSGENVRKLQQKLADMGLLNDSIDGIFGAKTEAAVSAAQAQLGVEQTGTASEDFLEMLYAN